MGSLSLGRPKWEGALGPREPMRGRRLGGASRKHPPSPFWRNPRRGTLGAAPRSAPSSKVAPLPLTL